MSGVGVGTKISVQMAVAPIAADSLQTSAAIDRKGFFSAVLVVENGAATGSPSSYTVNAKMQHCATSDGQFNDVTGEVITQIVANGVKQELNIDLRSYERFVKVLVTPALAGGSSPKALISAVLVLGDSYIEPV
jgi:hypothetical protein